MRKAFSLVVALVTLMLCTTLVASDVAAASVGTVGAMQPAGSPCFWTQLIQFLMQLFHIGGRVKVPLPT